MRRAIAVMLVLCAAGTAAAQKDAGATIHARGAFDVKLTPQSTDPVLGRMTADKQYHGDLDGTAKGEMLTGMTAVKDSAVYVAVERVTATLNGRRGSFLLSHIGTMNSAAYWWPLAWICPGCSSGCPPAIRPSSSDTVKCGRTPSRYSRSKKPTSAGKNARSSAALMNGLSRSSRLGEATAM